MLSPDEIREWALRQYPRFLATLVTGETFFPKDIPFGRPKPSDDFGTLLRAVQALGASKAGFEVAWEIRTFRQWKEQQVPSRVWFQDEAGYIRATGVQQEVERFRSCIALSRELCPAVLDWMAKHPRRVIEVTDAWPDLLKAINYFLNNSRPGLYIRELPIAVGTKFIEAHQATVESLLRALLPPEHFSESSRFEERLGLRFDEPLVRFRLLDASLRQECGHSLTDFSIPVHEARVLDFRRLTVIVTENKMNFLTLPKLPRSIGIWGQGNAAQLLISMPWLENCRILYWGDVDVHGFHILSRLRTRFQHVESVMMDEQVMDAFPTLLHPAAIASYVKTDQLNAKEQAAYLRAKTGCQLLEQEQIPHEYAVSQLRQLVVPLTSPK
jgi:hypothetical protein